MSMLETLHVNGASLAAGCTRAVVHILETSWQAAILVAVVVLLTLLLRERLAARWRSALWLVVVVRLLMPFTPESPVSLFNFLPIEVTWNAEAELPTEPTLAEKTPFEASPVDGFVPGGTYAMDVAAIPIELPSYSPGYAMPETPAVSSLPELLEPITPDANDRDTAWSTAQIVWLSVISVWFLGIAVLLLRVCFLMVRLHFLLKGCLSITTPSRTRGRSLKSGSAAEILQIFEAARRELRIRRHVELLASPKSVGPAVTGIFRPKLILAESLLDTLSHDELRLVFLHELSHIRRQDLFAQRLWQIAEIVHWFNPVVWLAARRWQTDRELACDEAVLARLDHSHRANYGHAILRVMESLATLRPVPGAVGVLMRRGFLTSRITKIATYRPLSRRWTALAVGLLLLLIPIGLTNAVGDSKQPAEPEEVVAITDEKVTTDESSRPDRDPALEKSDQTEKPDRADGAEVEVEPVDVEKDALPIPAQTITSSLRMVISTEVDRGEEFTGRTPGTVEIPACKKRVFYLDALSPDSVEDYKNELKRLGVKSVSLRGTVTDAQLKGYLDSGLFDEVVSLELDGQDLTDLSFFSNLTQLRSLTFRFSGKLVDPSSLSKLKRLESLHLYSCPNLKDLSCLSELKDLESLRLEFCSNLTDISALAKLVDLKTLILSSCEKVKDFSAISKLKNLTSLDVSYGEFSDVSLVSELKELKAFSMLGCLKVKLKEGAVLPNCKNLRSLKLHADSLSDLSTLSKCKNLKALEVHFSAEATATDSDFLSGLPGLTELIISGSEKLTDLSVISDLENLTTLQLFVHKQIDDSVHWDLKNLKAKNLKVLYLTLPPNVTDLSFLSNFKDLEQLSLMGAYETLTDFSAIADLKNLTRLELAACYCTDLDFVSDLEKLQFVNGQLCLKLTDISAVSKNENLKACTFCGCPELATGVSDLVKLKKLQAISFVACPKVKPEDIELLLEQFSDDVVDYQPDVEMPPRDLKSSTEETKPRSPDRDPALEKSDQPQKPDSDRADGAEAESNLTDVEKTTTVTCRCVDKNDQPIAGADVAVVGLNGMPAAPEVLDETITDAEGCYRINLTDMALASHNNFYVIARVSGKGLAWQRLELDAKQNDLLVRFIEEVPIRGQLVDLHGKPITGMRITCGRIESSRIVPFIFNGFMPGPGQNQNPPKAWLQPVTTDEEGRFVIHNLPPEIGVSLDVEGNDKFAPKNVRVNCSNLSKTQDAYREQITYVKPDEEVAVTLTPATIFEGVVRYEDTGQPVPHAQIKIWADQRQFNAFNSPSYAWVCGQADAQGRYRIVAKPGFQFGIQAYPPQGVPYLAKKTDPINWQGGRTEPKVKQVDVTLPRGILVRGIVVDSKSKQPIPRVWIKHEIDGTYNDCAADPDFYFSHFWTLQFSDEGGRFEIVVPPGAGCLLASSTRGDFASRPFAPVPNDEDYLPVSDVRCAHACRKIAPKADEKSIEVTMQLERGEKVVGRITDEKGELIDRACMRTQMNHGGIQPLIGGAHGTQILSDGHFELTGLAKGEEYYALFRDTKGRGAAASIKAGEKPTIVLKPCGAVTATCVNEKGQPVPFFTPPLYAIAPSHSHSYGYDRSCPQVDKKISDQPPYPKTDEEGNITFPDLIPDATYCIYGKSGRPWEEKKKFTVKPGETLDLGKIVFRGKTVRIYDSSQAQPPLPPSSTPATPWPPKSKEDTHPLASPESKQANPIAYAAVQPSSSIPAQTITSSLKMDIERRFKGGGYLTIGQTPGTVEIPEGEDCCFRLFGLTPDNVDEYKKEIQRLGIRHIDLVGVVSNAQLKKYHDAGLFDGITSLDLYGYGLIGLDKVKLTDISCLSDLQDLKTLSLKSSPGYVDLSSLSKFQGLTTLNLLEGNRLENLSALPRIPNLKTLGLFDCYKLSDISDLTRLEGLEEFMVRNCDKLNSEDFSPLSGLKNLRSLSLKSLALDEPDQDASFLSELKGLETLTFYMPAHATDASFLSDLKKLKKLTLVGTGELKDLSAISDLKELKKLDVASCCITDLELHSGHQQLTEIQLANCPDLTDIYSIANCKNLKSLRMIDCPKIESKNVERLQKQLPNCQIQHIIPESITDDPEGERKNPTILTGRCLDAQGDPVAGAYVTAIGRKIDPYHGGGRPDSPVEFLAGTKTSRNGSYRIYLPDVSSKSYRNTAVIARADGTGLAWKNFNPDERSVNSTLILLKEEPIRGRLLDKQGNPADGVRLTLSSVMAERSKFGALGPYLELGLEDRVCRQLPDRLPQPITTDEKGQFTVHGVAPGHGFSLDVEGGDRFAPQTLVINSGRPEERDKYDATYRPQIKNFKPGEEVVMTLLPSQIIEGVVRYEDTGKPAAHARLEIWTSQQERGGTLTPTVGQADALGRYRISAKPGVRSYVIAYPSGGVPYLAKKSDDVLWESDSRTKQIDVTLPRGVLVRGKVIDSESKQPIVGTSIRYLPKSNNPNRKERSMGDGGWEMNRLSDENGQFEIAVLPGPGSLLAHGPGEEFVRQETGSNQIYKDRPGGNRYYLNAIEPISPKQDAETVDVTLVLKRGEKVRGRVVNEKGEPVEEAILSSHLIIHPGMIRWYGDFFQKASDGRFELSGLDPGKEYPVYFLDQKNRLGTTAMIQAGDAPTIVLKPCGQANVTFVDDKGQPLSDLYYSLEMLVTPGVDMVNFASAEQDKLIADAALVMSFDRINYPSRPQIDEQGHATFTALIPGATYRLGCQGAKGRTNKEFTVKPGETLELGEIVVEKGVSTPSTKEPSTKPKTEPVEKAKPTSSTEDSAKSITISGRCVDENGKPIAGAYVAAIGRDNNVLSTPGFTVLGEAVADHDGRYELKLTGVSPKSHRTTYVLVRAEGKGVAWESFVPNADVVKVPVVLKDEALIHCRLVDPQGNPITGMPIECPFVRNTMLNDGYSNGMGSIESEKPIKAWLPAINTDAEGRFVVANVAQGYGAMLRIKGSDQFAPRELLINFEDSKEVGKTNRETSPSIYLEAQPGEEKTVTLTPGCVFQGIVSCEDTGKPIPHARLKICGSKEKFSCSDEPIECETDAEGRYRALVTPRSWFRVEVYPPEGAPYLARENQDISLPEGVRAKQVDVALPRGVLVYGKVIEKKTNKPISGAAVQYIPETTNFTSGILTRWQVIQRSDDKGLFKIVVLPGPGRLLAHGPHNAFVLNVTSTGELFHGVPGGRRRYANAILPIDPCPMTKPFGVTLWMERGEKVTGLVTNEEGEPAEAAMFTRLVVNPYLNEWTASYKKSCSGGQFEFADLAKGEEYPVHFLDRKKRLGATVVVKAGDKPTVVLRPCGQATATFVNQHGQPIADHASSLDIIITPSKHLYNAEVLIGELEADRDYVSNTDATNHRPTPTSDAQGRVTFPALIPGATYCVYGNDGSGWGSVKKEFTVKSGETLDLGEILLHQKDALPKKKTPVPEVKNVKKAKIASPPTMGLDKVDWSVPRKIER